MTRFYIIPDNLIDAPRLIMYSPNQEENDMSKGAWHDTERPGHKWIKRERKANGEYRYWYPDEHERDEEHKGGKYEEGDYKAPLYRVSDDMALPRLMEMGNRLHTLQAMGDGKDDTGFSNYDMDTWDSISMGAKADNPATMASIRRLLAKYKRQLTEGKEHGLDAYYYLGLADAAKAKQAGTVGLAGRWRGDGGFLFSLLGRLGDSFQTWMSIKREVGIKTFKDNSGSWVELLPADKAETFDFDAFRERVAEIGLDLHDIPTRPAIEKRAPPALPTTVDGVWAGLRDKTLGNAVGVKYDAEKKAFAFRFSPGKISTMMSNNKGDLGSITKWDQRTEPWTVWVFDIYAADQALTRIKELEPNFTVVLEGVNEARQAEEARQAILRTPIPEVQAMAAPGVNLFPYQNEGVRFLLDNDGNAMLGDEMGLGKTPQALAYGAVAKRRMIIVNPKNTRRNWIRESQKFFPGYYKPVELDSANLLKIKKQLEKEKAAKGEPGFDPLKALSGDEDREIAKRLGLMDGNLASINYESVGKFRPYLKAAGFDTMVVDECFGPETLVDTPYGPKRIAEIRIGDEVLSATGVGRVLDTRRRQILDSRIELRYSGKTINCSANHPFFTERGWIPASQLREGDQLVTQQEAVRLLSGIVSTPTQAQPILRAILLSEVADAPTGNSRQDLHAREIPQTKAGQLGKEKSRECVAYDTKEPYALGLSSQKGFTVIATYGLGSSSSSGQWNGANTSRSTAFDGLRVSLDLESCRELGKKVTRVSHQLQARSGRCRSQIGDRGRWALALFTSEAGREEGSHVARIRVDGVTVHQSGSYRGNPEGYYYDLEIEGHPSFTVGGALVHNSHRMKEPTTQVAKTLTKLAAHTQHHILLSGTAIMNKRSEFFSQFNIVKPGQFTSKAELSASKIGELWDKMRPFYLARQKRYVLKDLPAKLTTILTNDMPEVPTIPRDAKGYLHNVWAFAYANVLEEGEKQGHAAEDYEDHAREEADMAMAEAQAELAELDPDQKREMFRTSIGEFTKLGFASAIAKVPHTANFVQDILQDSDQNVIIFTESKVAAKRLAKELGSVAVLHHGDMSQNAREEATARFDKGRRSPDEKARVFVTTRPAAAQGINLTAANVVVFNDLPWTGAAVAQAEDRAHRVGQDRGVNVYWMTATDNELDQNKSAIVHRKYILHRKANEGRPLTPAERKWMDEKVSLSDLLKPRDEVGPDTGTQTVTKEIKDGKAVTTEVDAPEGPREAAVHTEAETGGPSLHEKLKAAGHKVYDKGQVGQALQESYDEHKAPPKSEYRLKYEREEAERKAKADAEEARRQDHYRAAVEVTSPFAAQHIPDVDPKVRSYFEKLHELEATQGSKGAQMEIPRDKGSALARWFDAQREAQNPRVSAGQYGTEHHFYSSPAGDLHLWQSWHGEESSWTLNYTTLGNGTLGALPPERQAVLDELTARYKEPEHNERPKFVIPATKALEDTKPAGGATPSAHAHAGADVHPPEDKLESKVEASGQPQQLSLFKALRDDSFVLSGSDFDLCMSLADKLVDAGEFEDAIDLIKAAGHKYIRRIPTGKVRPRWTYVYNVTSKHHDAQVQEGEKVRVHSEGQAGHYEVEKVHANGYVTVKHDETGQRMSIKAAHLHEMFSEEHQPAIDAAHQRLQRTVEAAKVHGTEKQQAMAKEALRGHEERFSIKTPERIATQKAQGLSVLAKTAPSVENHQAAADAHEYAAGFDTEHAALHKEMAKLHRENARLRSVKAKTKKALTDPGVTFHTPGKTEAEKAAAPVLVLPPKAGGAFAGQSRTKLTAQIKDLERKIHGRQKRGAPVPEEFHTQLKDAQDALEALGPYEKRATPKAEGAFFGSKQDAYAQFSDEFKGDFGAADAAYWKWKNGNGPKPAPWAGGELDAINQALGLEVERRGFTVKDPRVSSMAEGWDRLAGSSKRWDSDKVQNALKVMSEVPGWEGLMTNLPEEAQRALDARLAAEHDTDQREAMGGDYEEARLDDAVEKFSDDDMSFDPDKLEAELTSGEEGDASFDFGFNVKPEHEDPKEAYKAIGPKARTFKAWFGDWESNPAEASKVVKADGSPAEQHNLEPMPVYHGTAVGGFTAFDPEKSGSYNIFGDGFYFTEDKEIAQSYTEKDSKKSTVEAAHALVDAKTGQEATHLPRKWAEEVIANTAGYGTKNNGGYGPNSNPNWHPHIAAALKRALEPEGVNVTKFLQEVRNPSGPVLDRFGKPMPEGSRPAKGVIKAFGDLLPNVRVPGKGVVKAYSTKSRPPEVFEVYLNVRKPIDMDKAISKEDFRDLAGYMQRREEMSLDPEIQNLEPEERAKAKKLTDWKPDERIPAYLKNLNDNPIVRKMGDDVSNKAFSYEDMLAAKKALREEKKEDGSPAYGIFHLSDSDTLTWGDVHYIMTDSHWYHTPMGNFRQWAEHRGYDGIAHTGGWNIGTKSHRVWIAWKPNQIKATQNDGTFDPTTPDIRKSMDYQPNTFVILPDKLEKAWGAERPGHKYLSRRAKPSGGWEYEYAEPAKPAFHMQVPVLGTMGSITAETMGEKVADLVRLPHDVLTAMDKRLDGYERRLGHAAPHGLHLWQRAVKTALGRTPAKDPEAPKMVAKIPAKPVQMGLDFAAHPKPVQETKPATPPPPPPKVEEKQVTTPAPKAKTGRKELAVDVGTHVTGTRWEKAQALTITDLEHMTPEDQVRAVTKKNLLQTWEPQELLDRGMEPEAVLLRHAMEKCIIEKPANEGRARRYYMEAMDFYAKSMEQCATKQDIMDFIEDWHHLIKGQRRIRKMSADEVGQAYDLYLVAQGKKLRMPYHERKKALAEIEELSDSKYGKGWKYDSPEWKAVDAKVRDLKADFEARGGDEYRFQPLNQVLARALGRDEHLDVSYGQDGEITVFASDPDLEAKVNDNNAYARMAAGFGKTFVGIVGHSSPKHNGPKVFRDAFGVTERWAQDKLSEEERSKALHERLGAKRTAAKPREAPFKWERDVPGEIDRKGGVPVGDKTPQELAKDFGFKNVQFGHWVTDKDAQSHLKGAYGAFSDLAEILGVDVKRVSMNGRLSIGIGARGSGKFAAHYEPGKAIINITKIAGGGCLAHEWAHAMDNLLSVSHDSTSTKAGRMVSDGATEGISPQVKDAYADVMAAIRSKNPEAQKKLTEANALIKRLNAERRRATPEENKQINEAQRAAAGNKHSEFYQDASSFSKAADNYWTRGHEMFARAFESFVEDTLSEEGRKSSYLVSGTQDKYPTGRTWTQPDGTKRECQMYPQGEERKRINAAIRRLVEALAEEKSLEKALEWLEQQPLQRFSIRADMAL